MENSIASWGKTKNMSRNIFYEILKKSVKKTKTGNQMFLHPHLSYFFPTSEPATLFWINLILKFHVSLEESKIAKKETIYVLKKANKLKVIWKIHNFFSDVADVLLQSIYMLWWWKIKWQVLRQTKHHLW